MNVVPLRRPAVRPPPPPMPTQSPEPEPLWRTTLGRQLRDERLAAGDRIADVAERAGIAAQYLSELERGRKDPSSEVLSAVAGALGLTVREVTRRAGERLPEASHGSRTRGPVCLAA